MLDFSDQPYRYFPPKRSPVLVWLMNRLNRRYTLPGRHKILAIETSGVESIPSADRLLFVPNHSTHSDPQIMFEALRQAGRASMFMAAYDVFLRGRLQAWTMQHLGAFSVDREGSDRQSMLQATNILREGRFPLTVFPEGNVYLQNDRVTPFHDGAAFLAVKTAKEVKEAPLHAVPVSIKATHLDDVREGRTEALKKLASDVEAEVAESPLELLRNVGRSALRRNLKQRGYELPEAETMPELIQRSAGAVLEKLESKMELKPRADDTLIERVRKVRRGIHQVRIDAERAADHRSAASWADEAMVAFKIASYAGDYVEANPTLDRFAETVEKLQEDVYSAMPTPYAPRHVYVKFGEPIDLASFREAKLRTAVHEVTERCEKRVQAGLDELNGSNPHPGGKPL